MSKKFFRLALAAVMMLGFGSASAAFKDIKVDLTNANYLTEEEVGGAAINFGVVIAEDGTATRVAADDASANIVLKGKFHSNEHGWGNFSSTVAVEGPVRISMGSCAWGGNVKVTNAAGEQVATFNTNIGKCFHNDKEANIVSTIYKGDATTLTIAGGSYTPYIAVEAVDPADLVEEVNVTYTLGGIEAEGVAPEQVKAEVGSTVVIPANRTLYVEGKTLVGWTDGTEVYTTSFTAPEADVILTPVFADNKVALADREGSVTLLWDFQRKNGAPLLSYQGKTGVYVCQAEVNGEVIDVKLDFDTTNGKIANGNWNDWAQMNGGTILTIPSCEGAVVSLEAYSNITTTTIDGQTDYAQGTTISYTIGGDAETIDVVIGDGSYYRYIKVVMPKAEKPQGGQVYEDDDASAFWALQSGSDLEPVVAPADAFAVATVNLGDLTVTGTAKRTADPATDYVFLKLKPAGETKQVEWYLEPAKGLTFTPTTISMAIQRFGTDAENGVVIMAYNADKSVSEKLGTFTAARANQTQSVDKFGKNSNYCTELEIDLTPEQMANLAGTGFYLTATVGVGSSKEGGFANVKIEGRLDGTVANINKYAVNVAAEPAEAANVSLYPKAETYNEGASVKVSADKNFGYSFINWTDANGNVISEDLVFNLTVDQSYDLTANYVAINTYELNYSVDGGANLYMVQPTPAPVVVNGKNMYEEGTVVSLVASSNPILTFTNWSDGQTSGEISVTMEKDVELVANYSGLDYLVGWDFYLPGNNGRPADFASEDNEAAALVLRDEEGNNVGWLDKSQQGAGGYEGRPGGVNWRNDKELGTYYWQTKVNASAFTDLKVKTAMVYNYNSYQSYSVDYSIDGERWYSLGSIDMPGTKSWTDAEFSVPAKANNQPEVYFRWIADLDSNIDGTTSQNDGACIGATYIFGTAALVDDGTAPVLVSTVPAEGATNASANGKVVLTFDEKVKVAEGTVATLGEQSLKPAVTGKVVTFEYKGLDYATEYTFTLKGGSVMDLTDNAIEKDIVINFSTKERPEVAKAMYDFIVPDDGNFREAVRAANSRPNKDARFRIFIKQGNHLSPAEGEAAGTGNYESKSYPDPRVDLTTNFVSIIGEGMDVTSVTNETPATVDGINPIEGLRHAYTLHNTGTGTYIQDLKLINGFEDKTGRGEAYEESGDKTILKNVGLMGYQDTYCSNNGRGRYYFEGGVVRGRTDYICGKDDIYFNGVEFLNVGTGGYIAVPSTPKEYGWILRDCRITAENPELTNGNFTLGRPWGQGTPIALWINTTCEVIPSAIGWSEMSGGFPARFAEYNTVTANGNTIDLSGRKSVFGDNHANNPILSADEAAFYTIANVLGGDDDWDPTEATEQASAPTNVTIDNLNGNIVWDDSKYALLWAICKDGKVIDFTIEPKYTVDDTSATYSVRAANEMGGLGEATEAKPVSEVALNQLGKVTVVKTVTYNMQGQRVANNYRGACVKVETLSDGSVVTKKVIK